MRIDLSAMHAIAEVEDRDVKIYEAAKYYASQGIPVIPLPAGQKFANIKNVYTSRCSAKPATIDKWFHPKTGIYKGGNIAIGCGDYFGKGGVCAIDIDTKYKDKYEGLLWGLRAWEDLIDSHGAIYGPVQQTPSDGLHILVAWQEGLTPSQDIIAPAIDTRGGQPNTISSHIVVFPSIVDGVEYSWIEGGEISAAPKWITGLMRGSTGPVAACFSVNNPRPVSASKTGNRGNEEIELEDIEDQIPLEKVAKLLDSINPDDLTYEEWVRIGQAVHSQHADDDGLNAWNLWSARGVRYEDGECHTRWKKFKSNGPVRMATLLYIAQNKGVAAKLQSGDIDADEGMLMDLVDEYNRKYAVVLSGEKTKILRKTISPKYGQATYPTFVIEGIRHLMCNDTIEILDEKGKPKIKQKFDIWMASTRRRTFHGTVMFPEGPHVIRSGDDIYLNTWAGFAVEPIPGDWDLLKAHILNCLCSSNVEHYTWFMDWLADMIQDPANPKGCAIVLGGIEGAGKGTVANILVDIMGVHAAVVSNTKHLTSQYNSMITDAVFLFADEVVYAGNHEAANSMKAMVTERTLVREKKFGDQGSVPNHLHIIMSTNNDWKIAAGPESRRYFVLQVLPNVANDVQYFNAIKQQMANGGYSAMLHELQGREITSNLRYAPVTEELKKQRTLMSVHSLQETFPAWVAHAIDLGSLFVHDMDGDMENDIGDWPSKVSKPDIYNVYVDWSRKNKSRAQPMSTTLFFPELTKIGFTEGPRKTDRNTKTARVRTLNVPDFETFCKYAELRYSIPNPNTANKGEGVKQC